MDKFLIVFVLTISSFVNGAWKTSSEDPMEAPYRRDRDRRIHTHTKRHMMIDGMETKKRATTSKPREIRKKPSGHLIPLDEEDMDNEEVVSVAIGPPPIRSKYEKARRKFPVRVHTTTTPPPPTPGAGAVGLVKNLLMQLSKEFLTRDVDENFVFGQYLGNSMKNLTADLRLSMQHEILELILKYHKKNTNKPVDTYSSVMDIKPTVIETIKVTKAGNTVDEKKFGTATKEKEDTWPDFSNLAQIVS